MGKAFIYSLCDLLDQEILNLNSTERALILKTFFFAMGIKDVRDIKA